MSEVKEFEEYLKDAFERLELTEKESKIKLAVGVLECKTKINKKQTLKIITKILEEEL